MIQIMTAMTFFNNSLFIIMTRLAPRKEPQTVRTVKKMMLLQGISFLSSLKPITPLKLKKIKANMFVATATFEFMPSSPINKGTVTSEVPPVTTLKMLIIKEKRQAHKMLIKFILAVLE